MATKYFVLNNIDEHGNIVIGRNANWSSVYNWASSSGGNDSVGPPGVGDDAVFDFNSIWKRGGAALNEVFIDGKSVCNSLTINTGTQWDIEYNGFYSLFVYGTLNLIGSGEANILINNNNNSNCGFYLLGNCGQVSGVVAKGLKSVGGKRIYFDNIDGGCTITNCPFWLFPNPPAWVTGKSYLAGDYIFNSTYGHSYLCQVTHISSNFATDYGGGFWVQADQGDIPAIPNKITVRVTNAVELQEMLNAPDYDYVLYNDIDLTGVSWTPVGTYTNPFTGSFNGQNHKISNLNYNDGTNGNYAALFGVVGSAAPSAGLVNESAFISPVIKNITLNNFILAGGYACGALIGFLQSAQVLNCHVNNVTLNLNDGNFASGGLAGDCYGYDGIATVISDCTVYGATISTGSFSTTIGGLLGESVVNSVPGNAQSVNTFLITGCFVNGIVITGVDAEDCNTIGGFIGYSEGSIEMCYSQGVITLVNSQVGGFIGETDLATKKDCYSRVNVFTDTNSPSNIGGFIGYARHLVLSITNAYSDGVLTADASSDSVGGFVGQIVLQNPVLDVFILLNCYSVGVVTCSGTNVGGFAGSISNNGGALTFSISNCWSYTGSFTYAIGTAYSGNINVSMMSEGYGGDDTDNTHFYTKTHPVYASGDTPIFQTYLKDQSGNVLLDQQGNPLLQQ